MTVKYLHTAQENCERDRLERQEDIHRNQGSLRTGQRMIRLGQKVVVKVGCAELSFK